MTTIMPESSGVAKRIYGWIVRVIGEDRSLAVISTVDGSAATGVLLGAVSPVSIEIATHLTLTPGDTVLVQKLGTSYLAIAKRP